MSQKIVLTKHSLFAAMLLLAAVLASCEKNVWEPVKIDTSVQISFQNEVRPIFGVCHDCHGPSFAPDLSVANLYNTLTTGTYAVTLPDPKTSKIFIKISSGHHSSVSEEQKAKFLLWISQGAKNN